MQRFLVAAVFVALAASAAVFPADVLAEDAAPAASGEAVVVTPPSASLPTDSGSVVASGGGSPVPDAPSGSGSGTPAAPLRARFVFQIPTYFVEKSDAERDAYACDPAQPLCKANLDLSPTFSGESASAWACELDFGMGTPTGEEDKCNPNVVTLTGASLTVRLRAWRKADPSAVWTRELAVTIGTASAASPPEGAGSGSSTGDAGTGASAPEGPGGVATGSGTDSGTGSADASGTGSVEGSSGSGAADSGSGADAGSGSFDVTGENLPPLAPVIVVQSGLDGQGRCTKADCVANFISSLDGSAYACSWDLGGGTFSSVSSIGSCNPSYAHFPAGSGYRVLLAVTDKSGASGSVFLDVINPFAVPSAASTTVMERTTVVSAAPVAFAPVARIALQGRLSASKWVEGKAAGCAVDEGTGCAFNFDGRGSSAADASAATYVWDWGFGSGATGSNPRDVRFPVGTWNVTLRVADAYGTSTDSWTVEVVAHTPARTVVMTGVVLETSFSAGSGAVAGALDAACGYLADGITWACAAPKVGFVPKTETFAAAPSAEPFSVRITAQGPWGAGRSFTGGTYACATKEAACSANFSAEVSGGKAAAWAWDFMGAAFTGANPPSREFSRGVTEVSATVTDAQGRTARDAVRVSVGPPPAAAKKASAKKATVPRAKPPAKEEAPKREIPVFSAEPQGPLAANAPLGWAALAASGASGLSWLLARRWGK